MERVRSALDQSASHIELMPVPAACVDPALGVEIYSLVVDPKYLGFVGTDVSGPGVVVIDPPKDGFGMDVCRDKEALAELSDAFASAPLDTHPPSRRAELRFNPPSRLAKHGKSRRSKTEMTSISSRFSRSNFSMAKCFKTCRANGTSSGA